MYGNVRLCTVVRSYESEKEEESERSGGEGEEGGASRSNRAALPVLQVSNSYYFTVMFPPPPLPLTPPPCCTESCAMAAHNLEAGEQRAHGLHAQPSVLATASLSCAPVPCRSTACWPCATRTSGPKRTSRRRATRTLTVRVQIAIPRTHTTLLFPVGFLVGDQIPCPHLGGSGERVGRAAPPCVCTIAHPGHILPAPSPHPLCDPDDEVEVLDPERRLERHLMRRRQMQPLDERRQIVRPPPPPAYIPGPLARAAAFGESNCVCTARAVAPFPLSASQPCRCLFLEDSVCGR
jgi:hypothetical protein